MSSSKRVYVAVIGAGGVGQHFLSQLVNVAKHHPYLTLSLISRTSKCLFTEDFTHSLSFSTWASDLASSNQPVLSPQEILDYLSNAPGNCVLVDNTSSADIAQTYPLFLRQGISVVTPNKKAFSDTIGLWHDIFSAARSAEHPGRGLIYHESSVGAGLPVISTLNDLVQTGDQIVKIEGIFSGTMSFLFNSFAPLDGEGGIWSQEVQNAKVKGYTEPDPRDDLNGVDVARKLVILARIAGLDIAGTAAFPVQSLIPAPLEHVATGADFLARLPDFDNDMDRVKREAHEQRKVVRYVGSIDVASAELKVGLEKFNREHPIAALKGSDNIIAFHTKRYGPNPLIIQGAGAGGAVTAMGVTADLLKVLQRIA
ncbi:hypothetical protein MMC07_005052 [Pseudocyphellaria aurata]|nr:hypothetical protein [Pseudocyphellaria aurata]